MPDKKISPEDPRDTNKDGTFSVAEQKAWKNKSEEDVAGEWGFDLQVIKALKLDEYFKSQFEQYKKSPAGWSEAAFIRGLRQQPGFAEHSKAYQQDLEIELTLPKQWEESVQADVESLRDQALQLGAQVDDSVLRDLAIKSRRGGLNKAQMQNELAGYLQMQDGRFAGKAGSAQDELKTWAMRNGLPMSDESVSRYVKDMAAGNTTIDDVKADLRKTYLVGMFPAWADKINAGYDPAELFAPYQDSAKRLLEDESIGFDDPVMQKITQGVGPDGKPRVIPLYEAMRMIREDPRWLKTDNAFDAVSRAADDLKRMFGFG